MYLRSHFLLLESSSFQDFRLGLVYLKTGLKTQLKVLPLLSLPVPLGPQVCMGPGREWGSSPHQVLQLHKALADAGDNLLTRGGGCPWLSQPWSCWFPWVQVVSWWYPLPPGGHPALLGLCPRVARPPVPAARGT